MEADKHRIRDVVLRCRRSGVVVVFKTPKPAALLAAPGAISKSIVARGLGGPLPFVGSNAAVSDDGAPAMLQAADDPGDGVHRNGAGSGQEAMAAHVPVQGDYTGRSAIPQGAVRPDFGRTLGTALSARFRTL